MKANNTSQDLLVYLRANGPTPSSELVDHLGISRPTLSRRVQELGDAVLSIGKGRATQLAARHQDGPQYIFLYQVQENGQIQLSGQLSPIQSGSRTEWHLVAMSTPRSVLLDEFKDGLFPGWPWFLDDLRPSGFLGRAFSKRMADLFQISEKPEEWNDFELLNALTAFGDNLPGNFILGDALALSDFQKQKVAIANGYYRHRTPATYPEQAERALNEGETYGSSAGGEQPKFTTMVRDQTEEPPRAVIVKFSPRVTTEVGRRWADLLHAEHLANEILAAANLKVARTKIFEFEDRVFLESERFDRFGPQGRRGVVTLRALDAAYVGHGIGTWADVARKLQARRWIAPEDCQRMTQLHCFGQLIGNTDMHWGNLSFFLPETPPFPLAPVYDMLPMFFRPGSSGEIVDREFKPSLPKPEDQAAWRQMHPHALAFWQRVAEHPTISEEFQGIARAAIKSLQRIHDVAIR